MVCGTFNATLGLFARHKMLKIGHRGAPGNPRYGENTIRSFQKALWSGADAIEFDVRRTKDGKLVVIHDATLDRTTNGTERVSGMDYYAIRRFNAGFGQTVPLLTDVFTFFEKTRLLFFIELKEKALVGDVVMLAAKFGLEQRVFLIAFDKDDCDKDSSSSWEELSDASVVVPMGLLATRTKIHKLGGLRSFGDGALKYKAAAVCPHFSVITPWFVKAAHDRGLLVYTWTVKNKVVAAYAKMVGADGIISDFPELL